MTSATTDVPAAPWAPDLPKVRKALALRSGWVGLTRIEKASDGREYASAHAFHLPSELDEAVEWVSSNAGPGITLTWTVGDLTPAGAERINASKTQTGCRKEDVGGYSWVCVDLDPSAEVPLAEYEKRLAGFGVLPSLVVESGRGLHVFWRLTEWAVASKALPVLNDLVRAFQSDTGTTEPNRNLRLPYTYNPKPDAQRLAVVRAYDLDARYNLDDLSTQACEIAPRPVIPPKKARVLADGDDWPDRYRAAYDLTEELTRITGQQPVGKADGKWLCPVPGHEGNSPQLKVHRDNPERAICFGNHPSDMGKASGSRMSFDVLDLHAWEAGQTLAEYMSGQRKAHKPTPSGDKVRDFLNGAGTPAPVIELDARREQGEQTSEQAQSEPTEQEPWPEPVPLTKTPASVPLDGLPAVVRDIVAGVVESVQTPPEVALNFALTIAAAATRGVWEVDIHPAWGGEPTVLYGVALAESGERKSGAEKPLLRALSEAEKQVAIQVKAENRDRDVRRKNAEAELKRANEDGDEEGALVAAAKVHAQRARAVPELILSDTTTEALGIAMAKQGGAAALFSTEATAFRTVAGAYSERGKGGNVGLLNNAYDGARYTELRVGRVGATIPRAILSWGAAVQPAVLAGYADASTEGSGFLARFMLLLPESRVGQRDLMRTTPIPEAAQTAWDTALTALHGVAWKHYAVMSDDPDDFGDPLRIQCEPDAARLLMEYAQRLENGKRTDHQLRDLGGWIEKHQARLARIAGLFALLENPYATTISVEQMTQALSLGPAFIEHASATLRVLRKTGDRGSVRRVLDALNEMHQPTVSTRDVHQKVRDQAWCESADDVRGVLAELVTDDWLRGPEKLVGPKGGKPTERWALSPRAFSWLEPPPDSDGGRPAGTPPQEAGQ